MKQSLHVLRFALHFKLLPTHLEQRQAARSAHRNKRVLQCEASTSPRHRTRCAPTVSAPTPLLHTATALQHTLSTAFAVVRYLPCTKCLNGRALRSVLHCEQEIYFHRLLSHRAVHSHYTPGGRADLSPMEHVG